ncbi:MAG TPA: SDR family NAD(P)-dependent oxidoreductase, partial [Puia sp.]
MNLGLENKVIMVTGGARGIGEGIVRALAGEGAIPVIIGRNAGDNRKLQEELERGGRPGFSVQAELNDPTACEAAVHAVVKKFGRIEGLVNNAGVNDGVGLENGNYERFMKSLHSNLVHYYMMAHFALAHLKKSRGAIVNISSKTAETGQGNTSAYAAANGG